MAKLALHKWETRPYGERAEGKIGDVDITVRRPAAYADDSKTYIMANGWTAGKNSMRRPAIEAARFGHTAVTFDYTNTKAKDALAHNVEDFMIVARSLPNDERKAAIGLSMGGAVVTKALAQMPSEFERATLVASGMYLHDHYYTHRVIAQRFVAEATEVRFLRNNVGSGLRLLGTGAINCARRPRAIPAELRELRSGNVHQELWHIKAQPESPFIRFMYGLHDQLIPAEAQVDSIQGLPFDEVTGYTGGHARLAYDPALASDILLRDNPALAA